MATARPPRQASVLLACWITSGLLLAVDRPALADGRRLPDPSKPFVRDSKPNFLLGQLWGKVPLGYSISYERFVGRVAAFGFAIGYIPPFDPDDDPSILVPLYATLIPGGNRFSPYFSPGVALGGEGEAFLQLDMGFQHHSESGFVLRLGVAIILAGEGVSLPLPIPGLALGWSL